MTALTVHMTSAGMKAGDLVPGRDLVLDIDPAQGLDLPAGVLVYDHLEPDERWAIHDASVETVRLARSGVDAALTVDGVCLPWIWEGDAERGLTTVTCHAVGLRRAVERYSAGGVELAGPDDRTRRVAAAVAAATGVSVTERPAAGARPAAGPANPRRAGARRRLVQRVRELGVPSRVRAGSVVFSMYWPLLPLFERLLDTPGERPAVLLAQPPKGPSRSLRAAFRGGWVGTPGARARRAAADRLAPALSAAEAAPAPPVEAFGMDLGAAAVAEVLDVGRRRGAKDLATAETVRRAFRRGRPAALVTAWDAAPDGRLLVSIAKEEGVRTLTLGHGAFLLPQTLIDMDLCDEPLLWTEAVAPAITNRDRPVHRVGYPAPHSAPPPTRTAPAEAGRVLVLGQPRLRGLAFDEPRVTMRQYDVAIGAVLAERPAATVVLRPHPAETAEAIAATIARFPGAAVEVDRESAIETALAGCDLCIGTITTATLQAALVGTPVVPLNLSGFDWRWPLGGETTVPVVTDADGLAGWIGRWSAGEVLPGRDDLLAALGASPEGHDPTPAIAAIVAGEAA